MSGNRGASTQPDFIGAILVSGILFALSWGCIWLATYACIRQVEGQAILTVRPAAVASAQYTLSKLGASLPQRRIGSWRGAPSWHQIEQYYGRYPGVMRAVKVSSWVAVGGAAVLSIWVFLALMQPRPAEIYRSGPRLTRKPREFLRSLAEPMDGVSLHPDVRLSHERETRHLLVVGGTGTGKSQVIGHLLGGALARHDPVLLYDFKGDMTRAHYLPEDGALLAPWDARGWSLAVARDVTSKELARTLAEALIPTSGADPMWSSAARIIATALFCACIAERPGRWTFQDVMVLFRRSDDDLRGMVGQFAPEGLRLVDDIKGRTSQSILITLAAHMAPIQSLAEAWAGIPEERSLSISHWLDTGSPRVLILQGNGELHGLATALSSAVFRILMAAIASPRLAESRERRRWFFGDEFLQLGKVEQLVPLLQTARSKGVRFVLAAQDVPGVREIYGVHAAESILGAAGTVVVTGSNCTATREWASRLVGNQVIERLEATETYAAGGRSSSRRWAEVSKPALKPEEIGTQLGQFRVGGKPVTRALLMGSPGCVGVLDWPRLSPPAVAKPYEPAAWTTAPLADPAENLGTATAEPDRLPESLPQAGDIAGVIESPLSAPEGGASNAEGAKPRRLVLRRKAP